MAISCSANGTGHLVDDGWMPHNVADCNGEDAGTSAGATPDPSFCGSSADQGLFAVCWDQKVHLNGTRPGPFCAYKRVTGTTCSSDSGVPGAVSECAHR